MSAPSLSELINRQVHIVVYDGREIDGTLLAFDGHMNLVVAQVQESRTTKAGNVEKRSLPLIMLRGNIVVSVNGDGVADTSSGARVQAGPGQGIPL